MKQMVIKNWLFGNRITVVILGIIRDGLLKLGIIEILGQVLLLSFYIRKYTKGVYYGI